jgi:adenylate cyclase class 2
MAIEIEKKYRLSKQKLDAVIRRLPEIGARHLRDDTEENVLYHGAGLDDTRSVLRLRRVDRASKLTYKERFPSASPIKHQREEETGVSDPDSLDAILQALGFRPAVIYEKRRQYWRLGRAEIAIDELPFGFYMEVEGAESEILSIETRLGIKGLKAEHATYPQLTQKYGKRVGDLIESRFRSPKKRR